jgi:hypothetical protein
LVLFAAHGFTHEWWRPREHPAKFETAELLLKPSNYSLAPMLDPLFKHQGDMLLLDGMLHDNQGVGGEIQHGGHFGVMTCRPGRDIPGGPSFDQYVAGTLSKDAPQPSLLFGMWGRASESSEPLDTTSFAAGKERPRSHFVNAGAMLESAFGRSGPSGPNPNDLKATRLRDVLRADIARLNQALSAQERDRLALYTAALEQYDRRRELRAAVNCDAPEGASGSGPQAHFEAMFDLGILGLKCGMTNVVGIVTGEGGQPRHNVHMPVYEDIGEIGSHGWDHARLLAMHRLHTTLIERLWTELLNTPTATGTLADETVVLYMPTNGLTYDNDHHSTNYGNKNRAEWPLMMLTRVPGLRTGGDYIAFNPRAGDRTFPEFLHALCKPLGVDPSGFGTSANPNGKFDGPLEIIWT